MKKALHRSIEFIVEVPENAKTEAEPERFEITPESLENVSARQAGSRDTFLASGGGR